MKGSVKVFVVLTVTVVTFSSANAQTQDNSCTTYQYRFNNVQALSQLIEETIANVLKNETG